MDAFFISAEYITLCAQCAHVLVAGTGNIPKQAVLDGLPSVDEVIRNAQTFTACSLVTSSVDFMANPFLFVAAVCEQLDEHERALPYLAAALSPDLSKAGSQAPTVRATGLLMQARAYAALGRTAEAAKSFEGCAEVANRYQLWLLEAFALRDLKLCVLDEMGHGEHGARRLGAALRLLTGPAELLTPMLKGLDAAEVMAMGAPEAGYECVYTEEDADVAALRVELGGLKLMALQKRAMSEGIDEDRVEDAMEAAEPKAKLIELLVERHVSAAGDEKDRELTTLQGLSIKELRRKARHAGVDEDHLEDTVDEAEPKAAVIALLLERFAVPEGVPPRRR